MRRASRVLPICAAILFVGAASPGRPWAADTAEISSVPVSQMYNPDSRLPAPDGRITPYRTQQPANRIEPSGLQEYMDAAEEISLFGIHLRIDQRKAGQNVQGLLVVEVAPGSPGAAAGLRPYRQTARDLLGGVSMIAAMAFPPAALALPIVESVPLGESYDLIIGVDGSRVTNFLDLYACVRDFQPGEIVYLNILRNGRRVQVPVHITAALPPPQAWVR